MTVCLPVVFICRSLCHYPWLEICSHIGITTSAGAAATVAAAVGWLAGWLAGPPVVISSAAQDPEFGSPHWGFRSGMAGWLDGWMVGPGLFSRLLEEV